MHACIHTHLNTCTGSALSHSALLSPTKHTDRNLQRPSLYMPLLVPIGDPYNAEGSCFSSFPPLFPLSLSLSLSLSASPAAPLRLCAGSLLFIAHPSHPHPRPLPSIFLPCVPERRGGGGGGGRQRVTAGGKAAVHTHKLDLVNEGEIAGGERSAAGRGEARRGERERLRGEKKKKRWMHVCGGEKTLGLVVGSPARLYSCQNSFIRIIHLSSAVCLCVCGSSSVGGLACLLLRCYNLPGSGGTIIRSEERRVG